MNQNKKAIELLHSLGLNRLEAEVYTFLLEQPEPVTAYRAGRALGRPTANVYKAIEALARKGAVVIDEGSTRLCRPSPPAEFLGQIEKNLKRRTQQAADLLSHVDKTTHDDGIYHIHAAPLVLERCHAMLARSEKIVVVDAFPAALKAVLPSIHEAVARKVEVYVQTYTACSIPGAHVVLSHQSEEILAHWKSQQLNVVTDSQEVLLALLHDDLSGVYQAVWTSGLYLSCAMHVGLIREHTFHAIAAFKERPDFPEELLRLIDRQPFFHTATVPGQQKLFARFGVINET
jgi:HTH-type transcriptional regulator, sugar sensing transcriptional regulator